MGGVFRQTFLPSDHDAPSTASESGGRRRASPHAGPDTGNPSIMEAARYSVCEDYRDSSSGK